MLSRRQTMTGIAGALAAAAAGGERFARAAGRVPYGACVRPGPLAAEADYRAALRDYCQQITPEGGLYWVDLRPTHAQFKFDIADAIVAFAEANGMRARGHTLVWYGAMPDWTKEIASAR
jgi:endo-1,4-beta-xylanase